MPILNNCPVCRSAHLAQRPEKLRDTADISVLQCGNCGHVFLDSFDHVGSEYFTNDQFLLSKPFLEGIDARLRHYEHENQERAKRVGPLVLNKTVLDYGCGAGALLEKIAGLASSIDGLEPTHSFRERLMARGHKTHADLGELDRSYDVILMFHVLEHLPDPVAVIKTCVERLTPGGLLYIEVPNINDALLTLFDVQKYREFHFFRDHLHYFSRHSLSEAIKCAGAEVLTISGHNRFGLANHLYWLRHGKPGGHKIWNFLENPAVFEEYTKGLAAADLSDSLVAQIRRHPAK